MEENESPYIIEDAKSHKFLYGSTLVATALIGLGATSYALNLQQTEIVKPEEQVLNFDSSKTEEQIKDIPPQTIGPKKVKSIALQKSKETLSPSLPAVDYGNTSSATPLANTGTGTDYGNVSSATPIANSGSGGNYGNVSSATPYSNSSEGEEEHEEEEDSEESEHESDD